MSKKKKKKKHHTPAVPLPQPRMQPEPERVHQTAPQETKQAYDLKQAMSAIQKGDHAGTLRWLNQVWPLQPNKFSWARSNWLLLHWPQQAQREWQALPAVAWQDPAYSSFLTQQVLAFTSAEWQLLQDCQAPHLEEGQAIRDAFACLEQGQETEARTLLKKIGLQSPFRSARMFLRGLGAYYEGRDEEALQSFESLSKDEVYGRMVQPLLSFLRNPLSPPLLHAEHAEETQPAAAKQLASSLALWQETELASWLNLQTCVYLLKHKKVNQALNELRRQWPHLHPRWQYLLYQELPGTLHHLGLNQKSLEQRLFQTIPADPRDPKQYRLHALLADSEEAPDKTAESWKEWINQWKNQQISWPTSNPRLTEVLMYVFLAGLLAQTAQRVAGQAPHRFGVPASAVHYMEQAFFYAKKATDLAPTSAKAWTMRINLSSKFAAEKQTEKLIEEAVAYQPNHVDLLEMAAKNCLDRKAYDKGLRYIRQAREIRPLDNGLGNTETKLLIHKARKKYLEAKNREVESLFQEALEKSRFSTELQISVAAEFSMFFLVEQQQERALEIWALAQSSPWAALGHFFRAGHEFFSTKAKKKKQEKPTDLDLNKWVQHPTTVPTESELNILLALYRDDSFPYKPPFVDLFLRTIRKALVVGAELLQEHDDFDLAARILIHPHEQLKLYELAQTRFPACNHFVRDRYETALACQMPPEYFVNAIQELEHAKDDDDDGDEFDDDDDSDEFDNPFIEIIERMKKAFPRADAQKMGEEVEDLLATILGEGNSPSQRQEKPKDSLIEKIKKHIAPKPKPVQKPQTTPQTPNKKKRR